MVFLHRIIDMLSHSRRELLVAIASADADQALASSTKMKYRSAVISFLNFCHQEGFSSTPSIKSISAFISTSCRRTSTRTGRTVSPCTVEAYLSGIASAFQQIMPNISSITSHPEVRKVLKGCKKQFLLPVNRKEPLSIQDLVRVSTSSPSNFDSLLFTALLLVGFHSLHRLGELTLPDNPKSRDSRKIISRLSVIVSDCGSFIRYVLPYHKGDSFFLGSTVIMSSCHIPGACPVTALLSFLKVRDDAFITSPHLFITSMGSPPTRSWFLTRFRRFFGTNKSGHSMRSGGASALAQAGLPQEHIQDVGRWSSEAFKTYIRDHPIMRLPLQRRFPLSVNGHLGAEVTFAGPARPLVVAL